jgi:CO/xanthine dehydrogenase FAD-binding subunit
MSLINEPDIKHFCPKTIIELDDFIVQNKTPVTFVAGATDLLVQENRWYNSNNLVSVESVQELNQTLKIDDKGVLIGASLPLSKIISNPAIQSKLPILVETCKLIGSVQIQNRATLGGNIANASPAGDSLPVLSVLNAELWTGPKENNEFEKLTIEKIMTGPGQISLTNNRYIAYICIPFPKEENQFWYFRKVGQREAMAISKVSLAIIGWIKNKKIENIKICAGSVTAQIKRAYKTEEILKDKILSEELIDSARKQLMDEVAPITDIRSTEEYRKKVAGEILREAIYLQILNSNS